MQPEIDNANIHEQVAIIYQQASYFLLILLLICLIIFWIYFRKFNKRKAQQAKVEHALLVAEAKKNEAEKSVQDKISFLAHISHEIRTPMNGVFGMAEALSFTNLDQEQQQLLSTLQNSANNLLLLLNDVLDFSKMEAGKLTLELVPVNLFHLTQSISQSFAHPERDKSLTFELDIDTGITHSYFTDPTRLTQVFNNLVNNAVKFTEKGSIKISIEIIERQTIKDSVYDTLKLSVTDTGIGIAKKNQALLFTPFMQADSEITRKYGGTGLGLSICQEIIHAMGGNINLQSTENVGSTFHFTLTFKQAGLDQEAIDRRKNIRVINSADDQRFKNLKVLIAEDNLINIKVLTSQLARLNINADVAENGEEALAMHKINTYDIIISDCHMPILDGFELAKRLSQQANTKPLWLIAITADALNGTSEKCLATGFDDYMAKPCAQKTITDKLNRAYRQLQLKKELVPHTVESRKNYQLFDPQDLLKNNDLDLILSRNIGQLFVNTWPANKKHLQVASQAFNFKTIYLLTRQLKSSVKYLCHSKLDTIAQQIEHQVQIQKKEDLDSSTAQLIQQLDLLASEIKHWLISTD